MATKTNWQPGSTVCRCCFAEGCYKDISTEYFWMGKREVYSEMLLDTFDVSISYALSGPNSNSRLICEPCISRLRDATDFKRQVQECERTFMTHLNPVAVASTSVEALPESEKEELKLEQIKVEIKLDEPNYDDDDHAFQDDDDDDMDDQPLTALASKVPKKETMDLSDLLDNAKPEKLKRKIATKAKASPAKKAKKEVKPSASKAKEDDKKKKGTDSTRRIVPLFQVAYDRSLGKPISAMDTKKLRLPSSFIPQKPKPKPREREPSISRSPSPIDYSFDNETDEKAVEKSTKKTRRNYFDVRQNAVTLFEFSTVYPFIYGNNTFKCYICSSAFLETLPLRQHMKEAHTFPAIKRLIHNRRVDMMKVDVGEITCKICLHTLKSLPDLKHHLKEHGKKIDPDLQDNMIPLNLECVNGTYKCVVCEQLFVKIRNLIIHMSEHFNNYSCEVCGSGFMTLRLLRKHLEVHEIGNFPCDKCDKSFNTPQKLSIHNRGVHLKLNPRRCPICPERFNSNYRRTIHMQDVHNMSTRVYKCETCGRGFNLKYHMVCHVRSVHLQERNQQCDVCHQRFCNKETLKRHMIVHTGEKKYKCQFCGMAFLRRKNLKDHLRLHEIGT